MHSSRPGVAGAATSASSALRLLTTKEAAELVSLLRTTPQERWPPLLTLLTRWALALGNPVAQQHRAAPARPWERNKQQHNGNSNSEQASLLLQEAVAAVQAALQQTAQHARDKQDSATAAADLAQLFVPAVSFLAAAVDSGNSSASVAAACEAATALAAAPAAVLLAASGAQQLQGLPAVLASCKALLLACKADATQAAWLVACLLAALHTAVNTLLQHLLQQQPKQQQQGFPASLEPWAQQQLQGSVVDTVVGLVSGAYSLGHDLGVACCRSAAVAAAAAGGGSSSTNETVEAVVPVLHAACLSSESSDDGLLQGLAGAVAAGLCAGLLGGLPPLAAAGVQDSFAAAAAAAWAASPHHQQQQLSMSPQRDASRQQLLHQAELLLAAVHAACSHAVQTAAGTATTPGAAAAAVDVGRALLGQAYGRLMSTCGHLVPQMSSGQQQEQHTEPAGLLCSLHYLTEHCCSMSGVFHQACSCDNAAAANAWLSAQQQQHPAQEVGLLARWLAAAAATTATTASSPQLLLQLLAALRESAVRLAASYSTYQLLAPAAVAAAVDAAAVRQQLDRTFALHTAILSEAWQAASSTSSTPSSTSEQHTANMVVALGLADVAALQFCRVQLPAYVELVRGLVTALATSSNAADAFLAEALPCYEQLVRQHPAAAAAQMDLAAMAPPPPAAAAGDSGSSSDVGAATDGQVVPWAVWLRDSVTAAQLSFVLPLLPVAVRAASSEAAAAERVLPLLLLLLPHPLTAVAQAAHAAFAGLLAIAAGEEQGQQQQLMRVVQQAVPLYLQRSLSALPGCGSLEGLASSYYSLLKNLPAGSPLGQLAANRVADRAGELAAQAAAAGDADKAGGEVSVGGAPAQAAAAAADVGPLMTAAHKLFDLLVLSVQLGDHQLLPAMLKAVGGCVAAAPQPTQQQWMARLYAGCLAVSDYTRKPALIKWLNDLQQRLAGQQQQQHHHHQHQQQVAAERTVGSVVEL